MRAERRESQAGAAPALPAERCKWGTGPARAAAGGLPLLGELLQGLAASARAALRRIAGMPDYEAFVAHLRACHPGRPVPTERQFFDEYLRLRYEGGPTRCC